jgi:hypothetical protein
MSDDDSRRGADQPTEEVAAVQVDPATHAGQAGAASATTAEGEARAAEIKRDVKETDARREQEETAKADEKLRKAQADKEREEREDAAARERAEWARKEAEAPRPRPAETPGAPATVRPAAVIGEPEPVTFGPFTAERPELIVGAALVAGFLVAKILRRLSS